jgi:hypothetical protein
MICFHSEITLLSRAYAVMASDRSLAIPPVSQVDSKTASRENASVSDQGQADGPQSEPEFQTFTELLRRFCQYDLNQWESWRCPTTYGYAYIDISRKLPDGHPERAYAKMPRPDSIG